MALTLRSASTTTATTKGAALTHAEMDANFLHTGQQLAASTGSSLVGFVQSGSGAVDSTVQAKNRQRIHVLDFMSDALRTQAQTVAIPSSDMVAAFEAAVAEAKARGGCDVDLSGCRLRFDSTGDIDLGNVDTNSDSTNAVGIVGTGWKIYFYGTSGACIKFHDCNFPRIEKGGEIFLVNDNAGVYGIEYEHCRWGDIDVDVFGGDEEFDTEQSNTIAHYLDSGPEDTNDNLYNRIRGRCVRTGWSLHLANADDEASRNNANDIWLWFQSKNGIRVVGCQGNDIGGWLEIGAGIPVSLKNNDDSIPSTNNNFYFPWVEPYAGVTWLASEADSGCDENTFTIGFESSTTTFEVPGKQSVIRRGDSMLLANERTFLEYMNGGVVMGKNRLAYTEEFNQSSWTKTNVTITTNDAAAPDGTTTADLLTQTSEGGAVSQSHSTASVQQRWTGQVFLKAASPHFCEIKISADGGQQFIKTVYVDSNWKLFWVTGVFTSGSSSVTFQIRPSRPTGDGNLAVHAWGGNLRAGYPGTYEFAGSSVGYNFARGLVSNGDILGAGNAGSSLYLAGLNAAFAPRKLTWGAAAPTTGAHIAGDWVLNYSPTAAGGLTAIWQCVTGGTPGTWRPMVQVPGVSADKGDAIATLTAGTDPTTQRWATELTADRAVTLSTTGVWNGAKFRIVRSAVGAFNLNVGTGPLIALAAGEWADVEYNGSAWMLTAHGALS